MRVSKFTTLTNTQLERSLNTSITKGLTALEAANRLKALGNVYTEMAETKWWHILIRQFRSAFVYLLLGASVISFSLKEWIDGSLVLSFVIINVLLGFFQEYKSEKTLKYLKKYIVKMANVIREGNPQLINTKELVPGDLVIIETGDIVPADIRIIKNNNILIDESTLTGESIHIKKTDEPSKHEISSMYKATNIVFAGTTVLEGKAYGIVVAVGNDTEFGKITKLTTETQDTSSFEKQINKFSKFILILTTATLLLVISTHLLFKQTVSSTDLIIFSIALAVGVIPEAMPLVTTFSLSMGAAKLAKKKVVVKRLSSIEDMGSIQILCTDKTGTITKNELSVSDIFSENPEKTLLYGLLGAELVDNIKTTNNSFDLAIYNKINKTALATIKTYKRVFEIPFNPKRRINSVLISDKGNNKIIVRGAAEIIYKHLQNAPKDLMEPLNSWTSTQGKQGKRVIAIAEKEWNFDEYTAKDDLANLQLVGLISFFDPIKETTKPAIDKAERLGIKVKIITGDSAEVAGAVAYNVGIATSPEDVITGESFDKLNITEKYQVLESINVFARVSPEMKYQIIELLQKKYEVGYLGDGINDAPALKVAGVAIAVNTAADISKEVADVVLLENNLQVIVDGIEEGRKTFINVTNYIKATLASNFGNFYAMAFATFLIDYLPMLPVQILLVNLLSDFPMTAIATDNVEHEELRNPKSYDIRDMVLLATILGLVSTCFDFMMFAIFRYGSNQHLQTNWFIGSILTELVLIYSIRTRLSAFKAKVRPSLQIIILTVTAAVATIFIPLTKLGSQVFSFTPPSTKDFMFIFMIVCGYFVSTETVKTLYYKYLGRD